MSRSSSESNSKDSESDANDNVQMTADKNSKIKESNDDAADQSELEEGQVTSDSDVDTSDSEFNDGFDDDLMGDEEDRTRLEGLSEKERETEIFKRIERRDVMKTRWEIERKLKQAKKVEREKDKPEDSENNMMLKDDRKKKKLDRPTTSTTSSVTKDIVKNAPTSSVPPTITRYITPSLPIRSVGPKELDNDNVIYSDDDDDAPEYFDPKERSKERKKNVEMNRTDDKRSNAMAMLKAKREGKQKRGK